MGKSRFLNNDEVAWIQFHGAIEIPDCLIPARLAPIDYADIQIKPGQVRQGSARQLKLHAGAVIIAKPMIGIKTFLQVNFAGIGVDAFRCLQSDMGLFPPRISVIEAVPVKIDIDFRHEAISEQEVRIAPERFFEQADALEQALFRARIVRRIVKCSRAQVQVIRDDVLSRRLRYGRLFSW